MIIIEKIRMEPVIISGKSRLLETIKVNGKLITFINKKLTNISKNELTDEEQKAAKDFVNSIYKLQSTVR